MKELLFLILLLILLAGCTTHMMVGSATVIGIDVSCDASTGYVPTLRLGYVRAEATAVLPGQNVDIKRTSTDLPLIGGDIHQEITVKDAK